MDPTATARPGRDRSSWDKLRDWFLGRRLPVQPPAPEPSEDPPPDSQERIGICCSGGGLRSAAYNLGALQQLQASGFLKGADYVAAVSGGSYMAASQVIARTYAEPDAAAEPPAIYAPGSPEERYLRNNSTYLAPGTMGKVHGFIRIISGMIVNLAILLLPLYVIARPLGWLYAQGPVTRAGGAAEAVTYDWMWWAAGIPAAAAFLLAAHDLVQPISQAARRFRTAWATRLLLVAGLLFTLLIALPHLIELIDTPKDFLFLDRDDLTGLVTLFNAVAGIGIIGGALRALMKREASRIAMFVGGVVGPVAVITLFLMFVTRSTHQTWDWSSTGTIVWIVLTALCVLLWTVGDLTQWSMHPFYKRRLCSAFAIHRYRAGDELKAREVQNYDAPMRLSEMRPQDFPTIVVCAAANVSDLGATPPGLSVVNLTFSPDEIHSPLIGKVPMALYEAALGKRARDVTLPAAVAMSGAAVSPSMGKMTRPSLRFLLALANVRLGVWLPSPRRIADALDRAVERDAGVRLALETWRAEEPGTDGAADAATGVADAARISFASRHPTPVYLVRELLGANRLGDRFIYVTDGGHYENLGLVELLRRGCTTIFAIDASGDKVHTFHTIGQAIELARADVGVQIPLEPLPRLAVDKDTGYSSNDHAVTRYRYPNGREGVLVYCKAAVTADAPWDVRAYRQKDKRFPTHSTIDQLFDHQQFESYRALGAHTAQRALESFANET